MANAGLVCAWHHSGVVVDDLAEAIDFYTSALGYQVVFRPPPLGGLIQRTLGLAAIDCELAQLISPLSDVRLELLQFHDVPTGADPRLPVRPGMSHTAYVVTDLDVAVQRVRDAGGRMLGEIVTFSDCRAAYCQSSAGSVVELEELPSIAHTATRTDREQP